MRHEAGTAHPPPFAESSNQNTSLRETACGLSNVYCTHSVVPRVFHQSKCVPGSDSVGSSLSCTAVAGPACGGREVVTFAVLESVGYGMGFAADSAVDIHTTISPLPRL